jgi:hypothetical protein
MILGFGTGRFRVFDAGNSSMRAGTTVRNGFQSQTACRGKAVPRQEFKLKTQTKRRLRTMAVHGMARGRTRLGPPVPIESGLRGIETHGVIEPRIRCFSLQPGPTSRIPRMVPMQREADCRACVVAGPGR